MKRMCILALAVAIVAACAFVMTDPAAAALAAGGSASGLGAATIAAGMVGMGFKSAGSAEEDIGALSKKLTEVMDQVKTFGEDVARKMATGQTVSDELKQRTDEALSSMNEMKARIDEIEQKMARRGRSDPDGVKSTGMLVIENEDVKSFMQRAPSRGSVKVGVKTITSAPASAGVLVEPQRQPGIIATPDRRMTVRDLLTPGTTASNSIEYVRESGFTNNAATVDENPAAPKPESDITFELINTPVRTIAHWVRGSRQILADAPQLQSYIDGRLRYGLAYIEELQLLKGDGTGTNLEGIITVASAYTAPFTPAGETMIDRLRLAMLQAVLAEYPATGHVLNPVDWARIELTKDGEGRYIVGNPQNGTTPTLWRLPVVETQAIDQDKFLTGAFRLGAQILDREEASVEVSTEDRDNFVKNMVTILAEERLALAIYRPEAFVYGDFGNVAD